MTKYLYVLLAIHLTGAQAATDPQCPGAKRIAESEDSWIQIYDSKDQPYVPCELTNLPYRVHRAFYELKNPPALFFASTKLHFDMVGFDPFKFVNSKTKHVFVGVAPQKAEFMIPGFAGSIKKDGKEHLVMGISPAASSYTDLELRGAIVHIGAHHYDIFSHQECKRGPFSTLKGVKACDVEWWNGAYVAEAEYYAGQANSLGVAAQVRAEARAATIERLTYHLNRLPGHMKIGTVLYPQSGGAIFFDGDKTYPLLKTLPAGFDLTTRQDRVTLVNKKGDVVEYDFKGGLAPRPTPEIAKAKSLEAYRDLIEIGDMTCALFTSQITCTSKLKGGESLTRDFGPGMRKFAWVREKVNLPPEIEHHDMAVLVLRDAGAAVRMANSFDEFKAGGELTVAPVIKASIPNEADRVFFPKWSDFKYDVLALDKSGVVYTSLVGEKALSDGKMSLTPELKGQKFIRITGPMLWSKAFEEL